MLFDSFFPLDGEANKNAVAHLENYHRRKFSAVLWLLLLGLIIFIGWASIFRINQVARATGEVIASSRVQVIQAVDGGVLASINVREGDRVQSGQILAQLDQTRLGAAVKEIDVRLSALKAKATRLRAEVMEEQQLTFAPDVLRFPELVNVEQALFKQRRVGLAEELRTLTVAVNLTREETALIENLAKSGDVNQSEVIRAARAQNDAEAKLINRRNQYLEDARIELTKTEDAIAQNIQILTQRQQQLEDSVFTALVPGIVKNVRVTTVGGVLRAGEELMQIIPVGDDLIVEAKVRPADIANVQPGLEATIRFDPFDYTIFGAVIGKVVYVSPDTLKNETARGEEIYYRVHISTFSYPAMTTAGKELAILPGMTAQVDIRTGDRTVMEYLLKPLRKTTTEAFGER
ncbi:HlyD family efflux transporter periplasmic adaptor subunit [Aliiglaciecola sp. LCG003]|uniref:HlyD family efflux transporter periplasmic adaptor subunit n=1 Tax=Aliiglaciecola sp. LCG003 TaxID=3053655 RepID=UPI002572576D|nr:HlyD family efflux transporter periplasmic adaptor subunit [Aliiglaciecola sp. LCG003]WJG09306.1 HlyD family efflux transporter periplasmic adaptor subunit [Aliiglaciecola sp. LCG003]